MDKEKITVDLDLYLELYYEHTILQFLAIELYPNEEMFEAIKKWKNKYADMIDRNILKETILEMFREDAASHNI